MCDVYSGYIHRRTHEIFMAHPASHSKTRELLGLNERELSEWEWKRGESVPEARTHNDPIAEQRLVNALLARFQTRQGIVEPMREAAAKFGITLVITPDELNAVTRCRELLIDDIDDAIAENLVECERIYAPAAKELSFPMLATAGEICAPVATKLSFPTLATAGDIYAPVDVKRRMPVGHDGL